MVRLFGPAQVLVPDGYAQAPNFVLRVAANTLDQFTWGYASAAADPGITRSDFDFMCRDANTNEFIVNPNQFWTNTNASISFVVDKPRLLAFVAEGGGTAVPKSTGTLFGAFVDVVRSTPTSCQYGTQLKPGGQFIVYLTPGLIDVWLAAEGLPWLAPLFTAFWFTTMNAELLCGQGPPPLPVIDLSTLTASRDTLLAILQVVAWPQLCQCVPGTPAPTPPTTPNPPMPVGWPSIPVPTCTSVDLCASLIEIQREVRALQALVGENLGLTTLLQRYGMPFAFVNGSTHTGLTGSSSFPITRLVGVRLTVTAQPVTTVKPGAPSYTYDLGWVSCMDSNGVIQERRISYPSTTWAPPHFNMATVFGYQLNAGVVVDVQELEPEA